MTISLVQANIVDMIHAGMLDVAIHSCNCYHRMGSGAAKAISEAFPAVLEADMKTKRGDKNKVGTYSHAVIHLPSEQPVVIINAYTQHHYGVYHYREGSFDYAALDSVFSVIQRRLGAKGLRMAMPFIGADRGNAVPGEIMSLIHKHFKDENMSVTLLPEDGRRIKPAMRSYYNDASLISIPHSGATAS
ncbi:MAG: hypothetical protein GY774_23765 [Planctomycetes bacterium]|nr:hypothetical protein [Planctomycetota bacterium]